MGINMRVDAISFTGKKERMQRQQALDDRRDQMLDELLLSMAPQFMNGEADMLIINTTADKNDDIDMEVKVLQRKPEKELIDSRDVENYLYCHPCVIIQDPKTVEYTPSLEVGPKKTLREKIREIFKK